MPATPQRRPGKGPRAAEAIFDATLRLLADRGYARLTIEAVAEQSGVNKTTIYRWYPSKPALLRAALLHARVLDIDVPDTGTLRGDLIALTDRIATLVTAPRTGPVARALLASGDAELDPLTRDFFADRLAREQPVFSRAAARGELRPGTDPKLVVDLIAGAVWVRVLLRGEPVPPGFSATVVDAVLPGAASAP
ncbi:TetR/AcrR family transcriptional regulator [Streptomyces sp. NPDC050504]|uniref:TetR/AcrR family transcriptional regulator n=1 Tax=Streptomyces sp. NPDC050504 TaxID=3365618 RepID=UPI0037BCE140